LPELVNGTYGGLSACTYDAPGIAPAGTMKVNRVSSIKVSGIFDAPEAVSPPWFTTPAGWVLKKIDCGQSRESRPIDRDRRAGLGD